MHIYVVFTFQWRHFFCFDVNFNYLSPKIQFGAFQLKLAHKMQESPDPHRLQWAYRLNCTDTIYAILMTS